MFRLIYISKVLAVILPLSISVVVARSFTVCFLNGSACTTIVPFKNLTVQLSAVLSALGMWRIFQKRLLPGMDSCKRFMCNELFMHCVVCFVYQR